MERDMSRQDEDQVYAAALTGSVETLNTLIQKDPLILRKLSLTNQTETPLHVSALLGHAEFTRTLSAYYPRLAQRPDSAGRTPLHLAAAEGHMETVQVLLSAYAEACLAYDDTGKIPLHYAAMRGEVEVVEELVEAKPGSVYARVEGTSAEETILHLCVKHNQLECLKLLVEKIGDEDSEFLNSKAGSDAGVTILQLALMLRHIKIIRYLVSLAVIRADANAAARGTTWTMVDVVEHGSRSLEIHQILTKAGIKTEHDETNYFPAASSSQPNDPIAKANTKSVRHDNKLAMVPPEKRADGQGYSHWRRLIRYVKHPSNWLVEKCDMLMVVATMISTMTFNSIVNPPGGVWSENNTNFTMTVGNRSETLCSELAPCLAGTAVSSNLWESDFHNFITTNTVSFLASLSVTLLLVSGFPLHNRVCMWLLSMAMCVTLTFMALTYANVLLLVVPFGDIYGSSYETYKTWFTVWVALLGGVGVLHTIRFLFWVFQRLQRVYIESKPGIQSMISGSLSCKVPIDFDEKFGPRDGV